MMLYMYTSLRNPQSFFPVLVYTCLKFLISTHSVFIIVSTTAFSSYKYNKRCQQYIAVRVWFSRYCSSYDWPNDALFIAWIFCVFESSSVPEEL